MTLPRAAVAVVVLSLTGTVRASGGGGGPPPGAKSAEIQKAERLIHDEKWDEAIQVLTRAGAEDRSNADIENWLGFAERKRGNLDAAFAHYDRALALDPKHRGAHEYVGEAYLLAGKPDQAKEHLGALAKLCRSKCEEYEDLEKDIEQYERLHQSAAR